MSKINPTLVNPKYGERFINPPCMIPEKGHSCLMAFFLGALRVRPFVQQHPVRALPRRSFFARAHPTAGSDGSSSSSSSSTAFISGTTVATLFMLATLHARRLYDDSKLQQQQRSQGSSELQFSPDWKATLLQVLPLRFISRRWGEITSIELPLWLRPIVYSGWARAFHSNLEEASRPMEEYPSLRAFFTRKLKDGARPLEVGPSTLTSPVDGVVTAFGQVMGSTTMIEQVKGFSYSLTTLLGAPPLLSGAKQEESEEATLVPRAAEPVTTTLPKSVPPQKGLFFCVIYLGPGDYHRIHSPCDWKIRLRRHFVGRLLPVNERAVRTIKNLYVVNERVVLEGEWSQGLMAMAAVGATNVGSIELAIEPEFKSNLPLLSLRRQAPPIVATQEYDGSVGTVKAGDEVAVFNLGSTVVLVFEAPDEEEDGQFRFLLGKGQRVKMGEAIGKW